MKRVPSQVIASGVALVVLGVAVLTTAAAAEDGPERTDASGFVSYAQSVGEMPRNNLERPVAVRRALTAATELFEFNKDLFLGAYVEEESERVAIVASSDLGERRARRTFRAAGVDVSIERSKFSHVEVEAIGDWIRDLSPTLAEQIVMSGTDPQRQGVRLMIDGELSDSDFEALDDFARALRLDVQLVVTEGLTISSLG